MGGSSQPHHPHPLPASVSPAAQSSSCAGKRHQGKQSTAPLPQGFCWCRGSAPAPAAHPRDMAASGLNSQPEQILAVSRAGSGHLSRGVLARCSLEPGSRRSSWRPAPAQALRGFAGALAPRGTAGAQPSGCGLSGIAGSARAQGMIPVHCAPLPLWAAEDALPPRRRARQQRHVYCQPPSRRGGFLTAVPPPRTILSAPLPPPKHGSGDAQPSASIPPGWHRGPCEPPALREEPQQIFLPAAPLPSD